MRKIRLGILGCGAIAQFAHIPAARKSEHVQLTALCDLREDLLQTLAAQYQVPQAFTDHQDFLRNADVEAIVLAVPDPLHLPLALDCIRAGKHLLIEKPLAQNSREAAELSEALEGIGLIVVVGNMKRHDPGIEFAREFVRDRLGTLLSVSGWYCDSQLRRQMEASLLMPLVESAYPRNTGADPRADVENYSLITHGIHLVNTLQFLGGPIARLTAKSAQHFGSYSWHAVLEYENGAIGHCELTVKVRSDWSEGFEVHGEGGSVTGRTFLPFFRRPSEVRAFDFETGITTTPAGSDSDPYKRQLDSLARSVVEGAPVVCSVQEATRDLLVIEALKRSARTGGWAEV